MANWQDHGVIASIATTFPWADLNAWAGQIVARNNKFYMYLPMRRRGGNMAIGVAVANSITGPWKDALGKPLLENGRILQSGSTTMAKPIFTLPTRDSFMLSSTLI